MRCDNCPLCPTAEDDACPIMYTEYGMEHTDGMGGCRHSWNWCKKKADEYAEYLGQMGREMGMMMDAEHKGFIEGYNQAIRDIVRRLNMEYHGMMSDESMKIYQIAEFIDGFKKEGEQNEKL